MDIGQIAAHLDGSLGADVARQTVQEGVSQVLVAVAKSAWALLPAPARFRLRRRKTCRRAGVLAMLASLFGVFDATKLPARRVRRVGSIRNVPKSVAGKRGKGAARRTR